MFQDDATDTFLIFVSTYESYNAKVHEEVVLGNNILRMRRLEKAILSDMSAYTFFAFRNSC